MLDQYQNQQPVVYKILKNAVSKDKYSHAYLFETNGFQDSFNFIFSFVKTIMCPHSYMNTTRCQNCKQCEVIESNNFPEIEIINPEGLWIKKEQLQRLQDNFNKKAIIGNKKIYIINGAEKLNKQAANSILKFLEEPEDGIIAILITENIYQILETIRSRCQILNLKEEKQNFTSEKTLDKLYFTVYNSKELEEENIVKLEKVIAFVDFYETNRIDTLLYMQKLFHDYIKTKEEFIIAFNIMISYYKDILNNKTNRSLEIFNDNEKNIIQINSINNLDSICNKMNVLTKFKEKIKYNANTNLLMDKLIIELEGGV